MEPWVLQLVEKGGITLLALVALGWWILRMDAAAREDRAKAAASAAEERAAHAARMAAQAAECREERREDRERWLSQLQDHQRVIVANTDAMHENTRAVDRVADALRVGGKLAAVLVLALGLGACAHHEAADLTATDNRTRHEAREAARTLDRHEEPTTTTTRTPVPVFAPAAERGAPPVLVGVGVKEKTTTRGPVDTHATSRKGSTTDDTKAATVTGSTSSETKTDLPWSLYGLVALAWAPNVLPLVWRVLAWAFRATFTTSRRGTDAVQG